IIQLGVSYSDIVVATVNARPNVTLAALSAVCTGSPTITLSGGSPSGGTYTVNGTSATTFNPNTSGNYTIVYSYSDGNGCSNTASRTLTVNQTTAVTITSSRDSINAGGSVSLTATNLPLGTYSWTPGSTLSATNSQIVVATPTATTTYSVTGTNISGCPSTASKTIVVLSLPSVNAGNDTTLCQNSGSINLVGSPAGGTWSGTGVSGNSFNPNSVGIFTITYTYAQLGSNFTDTRVITVAANPSVSLSTFSARCEGDPSFALSGGSPSGGSYTVDGNPATNFNPSTAGTFTVVYSFTNGSGCTSTATRTITVNAKTTVTWNALGAISIIDPVINLNGSATPVGGVYSGTGVSLNGSTYEFDPSSAGAGTFTLTYTYVNS
ncbi:MAG: PKD domain-containing protein, partial [Bacteroidota bacterium]